MASRDDAVHKLMEKNDALEKRVRTLELRADLRNASDSADQRAADAREAARNKQAIVNDIVTDKRFRRIEDGLATR